MPLPAFALPLAFGVGGALVNHIFRPGQVGYQRQDFDYDPQRRALKAYEELKDPMRGLEAFEGMAGRAELGASALARLARGQGGSVSQASAMGQQATRQGRAQAYDAFQGFRLQSDQAALSALNMEMDRGRHQVEGYNQGRANNAAASASFMNNIFGGLGYMMAMRPPWQQNGSGGGNATGGGSYQGALGPWFN